MEEQLKTVITEVFNSNGEIRPCGREKCQELIFLASQIYPEINFGNPDTGIMNTDAMKELRSKLI